MLADMPADSEVVSSKCRVVEYLLSPVESIMVASADKAESQSS